MGTQPSQHLQTVRWQTTDIFRLSGSLDDPVTSWATTSLEVREFQPRQDLSISFISPAEQSGTAPRVLSFFGTGRVTQEPWDDQTAWLRNTNLSLSMNQAPCPCALDPSFANRNSPVNH